MTQADRLNRRRRSLDPPATGGRADASHDSPRPPVSRVVQGQAERRKRAEDGHVDFYTPIGCECGCGGKGVRRAGSSV